MPTIKELLDNKQVNDPYFYPIDQNLLLRKISSSALFLGGVAIGRGARIHIDCIIGSDCAIGPNAELEYGVRLGSDVDIGDLAKLWPHAMVFNGAQIGRLAVLHEGAIIGPGVQVPYEAQIREHDVVPVTHAIAVLGRVGDSGRFVTVYGSQEGPLYSAGCQYGDPWEEFWDRIEKVEQTTTSSAAHYKELRASWVNAGEATQRAYDAAVKSGLVSRLVELAKEEGPLLDLCEPLGTRYFNASPNSY